MDIKEAAEFIANEVADGRDGSYSFNYEEPTTGYFVGGRSWTLVGNPEVVDPYAVLGFLEAHRAILSWPEMFVGWWTHKGKCYVDISTHTRDIEEAVLIGLRRGEIAVWDITNKKSVELVAR